MGIIFNHTEKEEIENYFSSNCNIHSNLKKTIHKELIEMDKKYKDNFIWLITRENNSTIEVFDIKGDIIEIKNFVHNKF